ncbi:DUF6173 family protein [Agrobacterium tumefaciens]|uniref:DUF6173 family protein n=1 Tax=Agrobacterium tumefaciens TaxID=358 RepID=UPI00068527A2|nr:DUF6173 family protein [Agrobacterium tumefaciens]
MTGNILSGLNATMDEVRIIAQRKNNPAEYMYERMVRIIGHQQEALSADHELGVLVTGGSAPAFHLRRIAFSNPDILVFIGKDADNNDIQLMQHHSQMSVVLIAMPKLEQKAYRIGF